MISAIIFDLDGTLVQTEILKAVSYGRAAEQLSLGAVSEASVVDAFKDVVGRSRQQVAISLIERFDLQKFAAAAMPDFGVDRPWQAFVQLRLQLYAKILSDPATVRDHVCPHNVALLKWAREQGYSTGLATMSYCKQSRRVLEILTLRDMFDFVATREDVGHGKPDPEIYYLVARELSVEPEACLVIEDSPSGVKAAIQAGMHCIAVTSDFTKQKVRHSGLLPGRWIVDDPAELHQVAKDLIMEHQHTSD